MGFNFGSTKFRQAYSQKINPWVFESPLIRLMKEHKYVDAYRDGQILPKGSIESRSIWIFRYYDISSEDLGDKERKEIEFHAKKLREFILHIRDCVDPDKKYRKNFKVYLVAHSMGGLICRCYLQNPDIPDLESDRAPGNPDLKGVDKMFTYATPHGGIEFRKGLGWVEGFRDFLDINNSGNFGERRMKQFLKLQANDDVRSLKNRFPVERVFSLIGTDSRDYGAAGGLARKSVGPLSDGLVKIKNAYVLGSPRAYVHRSHSGYYGIVNSEEGYQNLQRFLFGDTRAKLVLGNLSVTSTGNSSIDTAYFIETIVVVRGLPIEIHRRTMDNGSAVFVTQENISSKTIHLHTLFLSKLNRVKKSRRSMGFLVKIRIVPQYYKKNKLFPDEHYEGMPIFEDGLLFEVTPDTRNGFSSKYRWTSVPDKVNNIVWSSDSKNKNTGRCSVIPLENERIKGQVHIAIDSWN